MEMTPHLSEDELAEFVSDSSPALGTHLEHCDACLREVAYLREAVTGLRALGNEPQAFWSTQHAAIRVRIASAGTQTLRWWPRTAMAAASVMVVTACLLLGGGTAPVPTPQAETDPDHELLVAIEQAMQTDGPAALVPAALLAEEINRHVKPVSQVNEPRKEMSHEN
jgi:hypothetical protein